MFRHVFQHHNSLIRSALCLLAWVAVPTSDTSAQTQQIRPRGRTLIEAEDFSAISKVARIEVDEGCSGSKNIGFFWGNEWFEMKVQVPCMLNYRLKLRTSCPEQATEIRVQLADDDGKFRTLKTIPIPRTRTWRNYVDTRAVVLPLPAGEHLLRFKNMVDGANVDYMVFAAGGRNEVVTTAVPQQTTNANTEVFASEIRQLTVTDPKAIVHLECDLNLADINLRDQWQFEFAILNSQTGKMLATTEAVTTVRKLGKKKIVVARGTCRLDNRLPSNSKICLRILKPSTGEDYIRLGNDVFLFEPEPSGNDSPFSPGWHVLDSVQVRFVEPAATLETEYFPLEGSFRPIEVPKDRVPINEESGRKPRSNSS